MKKILNKKYYIIFTLTFIYGCEIQSEDKNYNKNESDASQDFQEDPDSSEDENMDLYEDIDIPNQTCDWFPSEFCQRIEDTEECRNKGCTPTRGVYKFENGQCVYEDREICTPTLLGEQPAQGRYYKRQNNGTYIGVSLGEYLSYGFDWVACQNIPSDPEVCNCVEGL